MKKMEECAGAKKRLETLCRFLLRVSPMLFEAIDKWYNIVRWIDLKNLQSIITQHCGRVLEIGCGKGYFAGFFAEKASRYCGIDIDAKELAFLKKIIQSRQEKECCEIAAADAAWLPFKSGSFDLVFCNCVIEHIADDESVLREAVRVLKPKGEMVFTFPTSTYEPRTLKRMLFERKGLRWLADASLKHYFDCAALKEAEDWYVRERWQHVRHGYTADDVKKRLEALGMEVTDCFYYFTQPLIEVWEWCTFTFLNRIFPLSLLFFAPLMRCMNVTKKGNEKNSLLFALRAVVK